MDSDLRSLTFHQRPLNKLLTEYPKIKSRLKELTNPNETDGMLALIQEAYKYKSDHLIAIVAIHNNHIIGWSTLEWIPEHQTYEINVFVDPEYRGYKIGKQLVNQSKQVAGKYPIESYFRDNIGKKLYENSNLKTHDWTTQPY